MGREFVSNVPITEWQRFPIVVNHVRPQYYDEHVLVGTAERTRKLKAYSQADQCHIVPASQLSFLI